MAPEPETEMQPDAPREDLTSVTRRQALRLATRAPDSYVLLLFLLLVDYVALSSNWSGDGALIVRSLLFAFTVLLALHTSRVSALVQNAARVLVTLNVLAAIGVAIGGGDEANGAVVLVSAILLLACPAAIAWRLLHHSQVTGETIAGAVCIYVLIGMIFAYADYSIQLVSGTSFFAQSGHHGLADFAYFSYITMATVGYGDLTPTTGLPRTMAVLDAMIGQIFLVVLLARLVSMYRGPRNWRQSLEERIDNEPQAPGEVPGAGPAEA